MQEINYNTETSQIDLTKINLELLCEKLNHIRASSRERSSRWYAKNKYIIMEKRKIVKLEKKQLKVPPIEKPELKKRGAKIKPLIIVDMIKLIKI